MKKAQNPRAAGFNSSVPRTTAQPHKSTPADLGQLSTLAVVAFDDYFHGCVVFLDCDRDGVRASEEPECVTVAWPEPGPKPEPQRVAVGQPFGSGAAWRVVPRARVVPVEPLVELLNS